MCGRRRKSLDTIGSVLKMSLAGCPVSEYAMFPSLPCLLMCSLSLHGAATPLPAQCFLSFEDHCDSPCYTVHMSALHPFHTYWLLRPFHTYWLALQSPSQTCPCILRLEKQTEAFQVTPQLPSFTDSSLYFDIYWTSQT
jgi:hypothetical protein